MEPEAEWMGVHGWKVMGASSWRRFAAARAGNSGMRGIMAEGEFFFRFEFSAYQLVLFCGGYGGGTTLERAERAPDAAAGAAGEPAPAGGLMADFT